MKLGKLLQSTALAVALTATAFEASAQDTYTIGGVFPLTGGLSWLGEYYQKAAELQVEMINEEGGVGGTPLELVVFDDHSSPEGAARAAQRLISSEGAVAIIGTASVPMSGAVAAVAQEQKVPAVLSSGYVVDPQEQPFVFNTAHRTEFTVERAFSHFADQGMNRVALFMPIGPLGDVGVEAAEKVAGELGVELVASERFNPQSPDLTGQLAQLRSSEPDVVFSFVTGEPAAMVARNMQQIGFAVPLIVSHGNATPGFRQMVAPISSDIVVPSGPLSAPETVAQDHPSYEAIVEFNELHQERYGEPANYFSGLTADAIRLIAEGIEQAGTADGPALRDAIEAVNGFPGYGGVYNMSAEDHHGTSAADMVLVEPAADGWSVIE